MAFEPLAGVRFTKITERRTSVDWAEFAMELVDKHYPEAEKAKRIADKLEIHYTPKHGSWLNMAEIELSHLSRQCLDRRIENKELLTDEVVAVNNKRA